MGCLQPGPVGGACLLFAASFMILTGLEEMAAEPLDERKIFAAGIVFILGVGTGLAPEIFSRMPHFFRPFFSDPLSSAAILAVILYQIFHMDQLWAKFKEKES